MILYIMRHAEAVEGTDTLQDEWRYLTEKGRAAAKKMSLAISRYGRKPRRIITSPLTRAVQTAEIMATEACRKNVVVASNLLMPGADNSDLLTQLKEAKDAKRVMLVGHEPQLASLVARLLGREDEFIAMKKGACVAFEFDPDQDEKPAAFLWYLTPGKKPLMSFKKAFPKE